ncbi:MAG TPA: Calx-beta domain-containing protein [Thermoanaerobaculia bacterium]
MPTIGRSSSPRRARPLRLALLAAALTLAASAARATTFQVAAGAGGYLVFTPKQLTIHVGDTVTWTNTSGMTHNVRALDDSFRCANGCDGDGHGGNGDPAGSWTFSRTFNTAGTVNYQCEIHGPTYGMTGQIVVQPAAPPPPVPGAFKFHSATSSIGEGSGHATIAVERSGGQGGAVSVHYATADGTATAGVDYTAASGTLSWADGDGADKTFSVAITNRHLNGPGKTVDLALSGPAGGATLGSPASAVLTILDNSGPGPGTPPAAPSGLAAASQSTSAIQLSWSEASSGVSEFHVEQQGLGGAFQEVDTVAGGATTDVISGLAASTFYNFRVRAANGSGFSPYSNVAGAATDAVPSTCAGDATTLCLGDGGRFKVQVAFATASQTGMGNAVVVPSAPESGLFYFFNSGNIEMLVKVLNACGPPFNRYWVFFAATTNVQFTLTVTDTQSAKVKVYFNVLNQPAAPIQDTNAFATCP